MIVDRLHRRPRKFNDVRTSWRRYAACPREVELNRRLAPDVCRATLAGAAESLELAWWTWRQGSLPDRGAG